MRWEAVSAVCLWEALSDRYRGVPFEEISLSDFRTSHAGSPLPTLTNLGGRRFPAEDNLTGQGGGCLTKVFHQHDMTLHVVDLRVQDPLTIRRYRQGPAARRHRFFV